MKKLFVALLAVAGLTACFNEEVVNVADQRTPIAFDSFTDKVTRVDAPDPSSTTANLTEFYVWGVMDNANGVVFDDETVSGGVGAWTYAQQQYWTPGHTYYFAAFAGDRTNDQIVFEYANDAKEGMSLAGLGTATFKNVAGINDFLYAEQTATTPAVIDSEDDVKVVNFAFDHLLSKVKFTFRNGFINDNITVLVKNVKMEVPAQGTIDLTADAYNWTNLEGTTILDMGDMAKGAKIAIDGSASSDNERLTIPAAASQVYTVTFYVESWQGDVLSTSATKVVEITNCVLEPGKAYNFVATLDHTNVAENPLFPIVFNCTVDEWDTEVVYDGDVIKTENYAAVVAEALAAGGEVTLTQDVALTEPLVVPAGIETTLNLNGFDIINNTKTLEFGKGEGIVAYGNLTINGEGTVKGSTRAVWARGNNGAVITINGGNYEGCEEGFTGGGNSVVYASSNNVVNINGGTVKALAADKTSYANKTEGVYAALNIADNNGTINVSGGSFYKQNPAAPGTEPAAWNAAHANGFVVDGKTVVTDGDWFVVE